MAKKIYRLDDEVVAEVARSLQRALLTGTDIVDHIRSIELNVARGTDKILLSPEYLERTQSNDNRMVEEAQELAFENDK
jgi:Arc/MetJ family transcription regulator